MPAAKFLLDRDAVGVEYGMWSVAELKHHKDKIDRGEISDKALDIMGVTNEMLIDCVPLDSFIVPILHTMIGVGNKLLNAFLDWVDIRVEQIPEEERTARKEVLIAERDLSEKKRCDIRLG